jgi:hypothetical protein
LKLVSTGAAEAPKHVGGLLGALGIGHKSLFRPKVEELPPENLQKSSNAVANVDPASSNLSPVVSLASSLNDSSTRTPLTSIVEGKSDGQSSKAATNKTSVANSLASDHKVKNQGELTTSQGSDMKNHTLDEGVATRSSSRPHTANSSRPHTAPDSVGNTSQRMLSKDLAGKGTQSPGTSPKKERPNLKGSRVSSATSRGPDKDEADRITDTAASAADGQVNPKFACFNGTKVHA